MWRRDDFEKIASFPATESGKQSMRPRHVPGGWSCQPLGQMGKPRCRGILKWPASGLCGPPHLVFVRSFFFFLLLSTGVLLKRLEKRIIPVPIAYGLQSSQSMHWHVNARLLWQSRTLDARHIKSTTTQAQNTSFMSIQFELSSLY